MAQFRMLKMHCLNLDEAVSQYESIFMDRAYFQHGICLADGCVVVDVGANIGLFSVFVARHFKRATIYAFEPIPDIFQLLERNVEACDATIYPFNLALGSSTRIDDFVFYRRLSALSGIKKYANRDDDFAMLKGLFYLNESAEDRPTTLDRHLESVLIAKLRPQAITCRIVRTSEMLVEAGLSRIDLLKIDAQGAETEILDGIDAKLWEIIYQISCEVNLSPNDKEPLVNLARLLENRGFIVTCLFEPKNPYRGHIFARRELRGPNA